MTLNKSVFWIAPIVIMGIGLLPMPYAYYTLSRFVVCVCAAYFAFNCSKKKDTVFLWIFGFLAILYNPILPVHLYEKEIWIVVNLITALLFFRKKGLVQNDL